MKASTWLWRKTLHIYALASLMLLFLRCFILVNGLVLNITRNKNFETLQSSDSSASYSMNIQIKKKYIYGSELSTLPNKRLVGTADTLHSISSVYLFSLVSYEVNTISYEQSQAQCQRIKLEAE